MIVAPEDTFVRVLLVNAAGELLLQKRSATKRLYPGIWEYAAGGRKELHESWEEAALRELREELGIEKKPEELRQVLETILDPTICGRPLAVRIYLARYNNEPITPAPREVEDIRFIRPTQLREELEAKPENFLPGMLMVMDKCWDKLR